MDIKSLEIKNKTNYDWNDIININYFNSDLLKVIKIKSKIGGDYIYHILYNPNPDYNILKSLYTNNTNNNIKVDNIRYENGDFYLSINNLRGYFNFNNNHGILTMLFDDMNKQNKYYQVL